MLEPKVKISRRGAERLQGGHLWIYRSDVDHAPAALEPGDVVALVDGRGRFLAKAFWSARSRPLIAFGGAMKWSIPVTGRVSRC